MAGSGRGEAVRAPPALTAGAPQQVAVADASPVFGREGEAGGQKARVGAQAVDGARALCRPTSGRRRRRVGVRLPAPARPAPPRREWCNSRAASTGRPVPRPRPGMGAPGRHHRPPDPQAARGFLTSRASWMVDECSGLFTPAPMDPSPIRPEQVSHASALAALCTSQEVPSSRPRAIAWPEKKKTRAVGSDAIVSSAVRGQ